MGSPRRPAEGRAQCVAHYDGRLRLRRARDVWRRRPDPGYGSHRKQRAALHEFSLDVPLLTVAGGDNHWPQPSLGRLRGGERNSDGFPGYDSIIPIDKGTIGTILKANGYATSWFGKDHNTPSFQASNAGPFDQWPNGMGFDYFYGFVGGDASQWQPNLFRNTTAIYPFLGNPGWNLETAMADEAIQHMKELKEIAPDKPWFVYYVPGATHAPHHPTPEWITKIGDMHLFDEGWNKVRETIFANQKRLGIMPENAKLTPWPKDLPEWDSFGLLEKKLFISKRTSTGPTSPTPIMRSAASSRRSKISANSITR